MTFSAFPLGDFCPASGELEGRQKSMRLPESCSYRGAASERKDSFIHHTCVLHAQSILTSAVIFRSREKRSIVAGADSLSGCMAGPRPNAPRSCERRSCDGVVAPVAPPDTASAEAPGPLLQKSRECPWAQRGRRGPEAPPLAAVLLCFKK